MDTAQQPEQQEQQPKSLEPYRCDLPWRCHNRFQLLVNGQTFFPQILERIAQAQHRIDIELYLFESGTLCTQFLNGLYQAAQRGVSVRLLLDDIGAFSLQPSDRQNLQQQGIQLRFYNPIQHHKRLRNLSRDHRKILIFDSSVAFVGGLGVADCFSAELSGDAAWRETVIAIEGDVVADWCHLFERSWHHYNAFHRDEIRSHIHETFQKQANHPIANRNRAQARVMASRGFGRNPIIASLISELKKAQHLAWIATAYFYPSRKLVQALINAAQKGVDVRLLLPGPKTDHPSVRFAGHSWYRKLLNAGIRIYEYQPCFMHMKLAYVDDWVSTGSCNFDRWNLSWNLEANQEIIDPEICKQVHHMLLADFKNSREIELDQWRTRSWLVKIRERFWKWIGLFLSRLKND